MTYFFEAAVLDKVTLVNLDTWYEAALFVTCSVSAALLLLILLVGMLLSLELIFSLLETSLTTKNKQE